jgi:hypothetical protein
MSTQTLMIQGTCVHNKDPLSKYPLVLLLQLDVFKLRVYDSELITNSPNCRSEGLQYGRLLYIALAFFGRRASNAASEGCHLTWAARRVG